MMIMMILSIMSFHHYENGNASESVISTRVNSRNGTIGPILILNDSAFDQKAAEMNWTGNGSEADPYMIEDLDLNANGSGYGIGISTTYNFTISNCSIRKADGGGAPLGAISILSGNGTIMDCRINSSGYGIRSLSPCRIINNTIFDCHNGLWILNDDNEIFGNLIVDGANHAIHFQGDDSLIKENTVRNWDYGIYLIGGERNRVQDNSITNIDDHGIRLDSSHDNTVIDNYAANNDDGIFLKYGSSNNRISNNSIVSCEEGIYIFDAIHNEFYGNEMFNCSFYFENERDNFVSHTIPDNNTVGGKPVYYLGGSDYEGWVVPSNVGQWIVWEATNLSIYYSDILEGSAGIFLYHCDWIKINHTRISNQVYEGVNAYRCRHLRIESINISRCDTGILLTQCYNSTSENCEINECREGLQIADSSLTSITESSFRDCDYGIRTKPGYKPDLTISRNEIVGVFSTMIHSESSEVKIFENEFISDGSTKTGIRIMDSFSNVSSNEFTGIVTAIKDEGNRNNISQNLISKCERGIELYGYKNKVGFNQIENIEGGFGIIDSGDQNVIMKNTIIDDDDIGILLSGSVYSSLFSNELIGTSIDLFDIDPELEILISPNNTINGKPVIFYQEMDLKDIEIDPEGGEYIFLACRNGILEDVENSGGILNVLIYGCQSIKLANCSFSGKGIGIKSFKSDGVHIAGSNFSGLETGISMMNSDEMMIKNCIFEQIIETAINISSGSDSRIENCLFNGTEISIHMVNSRENMIHGNLFREGEKGVILSLNSESNRIENNGFLENADIPITVFSGKFNRIENNAFVNNGRFILDPAEMHIDEENTYVHGNYYWNHTKPDSDSDGKVDLPYDRIPGKGNISDSEPIVYLPHSLLGAPTGTDSEQFMDDIIISWLQPTSVNPNTPLLGYTIRRLKTDNTTPASWVLADVTNFVDREPGEDGQLLYSIQARSILGEGAPVYEIVELNRSPLLVHFEIANGSVFDRRNVTVSWYSNREWSRITHLDLFLDGEKLDTNGTPKKWSFSLEKTGWHELSVIIRDGRGYSGRNDISFFCDWIIPRVSLARQMNWTNDLAGFHWNATDNMGIENIWYEVHNMSHLSLEDIPDYVPEGRFEIIKDGEIPVYSNNISLDLPQGNFSFVIFVRDLAGNIAVDNIAIGVDKTAPEILDLYPANEGVDIDSTIWIRFSEFIETSTISFEIDGTSGKWYVRENNTYEFVPFQELDDFTVYNAIFRGRDRAGNRVNATWSFKTVKDPLKTTTVTGRIVDQDGNPITEARIKLGNVKMAETSPDGSFTIDLKEGNYQFNISKEGYINATFSIDVPYRGGPLDLGTITMESLENEEEREDPPYIVFALGIGLIITTVIIAISAFTRKGGPLDEE